MLSKIKYPTLRYKYDDDEEEFIFCVKGKPFPCLVTTKLPTPSSTLLDFGIIRELNLKMSNLQCKRFMFAGNKLRILGTVSMKVQCIIDGAVCGTTHIKADVVQDLVKHCDTECLAGQRMAAQLRGKDCTPSGALDPSPSPTPTPPPRTKPPSSPSSPKPSPPSQPKPTPPTSPKPPPGFPATPPRPRWGPPPETHVTSPYTLNVRRLQGMFADADLELNTKAELEALYENDMKGDYDVDDETGEVTFYNDDGRYYTQGHGRDKCYRAKCLSVITPGKPANIPYNCGFHSSLWNYPDGYKSCGDKCAGAFCRCIRDRGRYKSLQMSYI